MKLHLGCGKRYMPGYEHVDLNDFDHIDYKHSVAILPKYKDNSIELIYFSHGIEYFDCEEIKNVLAEYKRILKPGGILRLAVPNFWQLMELYLETADIRNITGPIYGRWPLKNGSFFYHKIGYDMASLHRVLENAGFKDIRPWDWRKVFVGELEGYDDFSKAYYPHMDFNGRLMSLNVECKKGE